MKTSTIFSTALLIGVLGLLGVAAFKEVPAPVIGAASGPEYYNRQFFRDNAIIGGTVLATSSRGTVTYTADNIKNSKVIVHTATAALTANLPASSTLTDFIPRPGDTAIVYISPVTTLITFAGGTGVDLNTASSTKNINAGGLGSLEFVRKADSDIEVLLTPGI